MGVLLGLGAALLYSVATVLQALGARRSAQSSPRALTLLTLLRQPVWCIGLGVLSAAFLTFYFSTRVLSLPIAEALRSTYLVLSVALGHVVFGTRARLNEYVGLGLVISGLALFVSADGERGELQSGADQATTMGLVLAAVLVTAAVAGRLGGRRPKVLAAVFAVLSGLAFAVLDIGIRSVPEPVSLGGTARSATTWIGAFAAVVGLVLLARAMSSTSLAVATTLSLATNVVVASAWAVAAFSDSVGGGAGRILLATLIMMAGTVLVVGASSSVRTATRPGRR